MNTFEYEIVKAIGKHNPSILTVIDQLRVLKREYTGAGCYIDFEKINKPIKSHSKLFDLFGVIKLPCSIELSAHIILEAGIPLTLEICCLSQGGWEGNHEGYQINN